MDILSCMLPAKLLPYVARMKSFLDRKIGVEEFEREFLELFQNDDSEWSEQEFEILDGILSDDDGETNEAQLRKRCERALDGLRKLYAQG